MHTYASSSSMYLLLPAAADHSALQRYVRMLGTAGEAFYQAVAELYLGTAGRKWQVLGSSSCTTLQQQWHSTADLLVAQPCRHKDDSSSAARLHALLYYSLCFSATRCTSKYSAPSQPALHAGKAAAADVAAATGMCSLVVLLVGVQQRQQQLTVLGCTPHTSHNLLNSTGAAWLGMIVIWPACHTEPGVGHCSGGSCNRRPCFCGAGTLMYKSVAVLLDRVGFARNRCMQRGAALPASASVGRRADVDIAMA
jgi:hypothetical protein